MSNSAKNGVKVHMDDLDLELVKHRYSNGRLAVAAYIVEEEDDEFGMDYGNISVNLVFAPLSEDDAIYLDENNLGWARMEVISKLGRFTGNEEPSGYCTYPEFVFYPEVFAQMRDLEEFTEAWS